VAEPGSVGDRKRHITEAGGTSPGSDSDESYGSGMRQRRFPVAGPIVDPQVEDIHLSGTFQEVKRPTSKKSKFPTFPPQDIPDDIKYQRSLLQDFYTAWKNDKFGLSEETEDGGTSATATALKMPTPIDTGLKSCEKLLSASDNITSSFSELTTSFLLFANAYPKHAPTCYKFAGCCFEMATIASQTLSASWKLTHGFTLSSLETAIDKMDSDVNKLILACHKVYLEFHNLYSKFVNHVTTKNAFELDEEFQIGYEQPPMESQVKVFSNVIEDNRDKISEIPSKMRKLAERLADPPQQEQLSGHGVSEQMTELGISDQANTLGDVHGFFLMFAEDMQNLCDNLSSFKVQDS
jgi:hypothetical protein